MFFNERREPKFLTDLKATLYPAFLYTLFKLGETFGIQGSVISFFGCIVDVVSVTFVVVGVDLYFVMTLLTILLKELLS